MANLASRHCSPLKKGTHPVREPVALSLLAKLDPAWQIDRTRRAIQREFRFTGFHETIAFVNAVAWIANREDHHPDLEVGYNRCQVNFTSHAAGGLTANDFICAAKVDALFTGEMPAAEKTGEKTTGTPGASTTGEPKAAPEPTAGAPLFNPEEADALLETPLEQPEPRESRTDDGEDEFELIEPPEPTVQASREDLEAAARQAENARAALKSAEDRQPKSSKTPEGSKDKAASGKDGKTPAHKKDIDPMATVILPPGMESVSPGPAGDKDKDEDATVILPPGNSESTKPAQSAAPPEPPQPNRPPPRPAPPRAGAEDPDEERTLVMGRHPGKPPAGPESAPRPAQQVRSASPPRPEEEAEKTMALRSDPLRNTRQHPAQRPDDPKPEQTRDKKPETARPSHPEREIEDDETLVMHANTYKPIKKKRD